MNASRLDQRGTLQRRVAGKDALGGPSTTWEDFARGCYANIRPLSSRELLASQAVQSAVSHEITLRWRAGVTAKMRFVQPGRVFDLGPPINLGERNEWLAFPATEGLTNG